MRRLILLVGALVLALIISEYTLRIVKSILMDGAIHIATPSINNREHKKYGWLSPASHSHFKSDECYGEGEVSYNDYGFRAPPMERASSATPLICILGDSTMQAYQLPDLATLPSLLAERLGPDYREVFVLPLAVGGYGSVQQ